MLPQRFLERMEKMLGEEYSDFLSSYEEQKCQALRVNALKGDKALFLERAPFSLKPVPWAEEGFYYRAEEQPGKHPYHAAGVYYIQEPSAMVPAEWLEAEPGERILDLCGAPGGKSTQIAAKMHGRGILVCNEVHPARARILSENVERMGICNAIVANETPQKLSECFSGYFDRILVDAPCSGEGMFRKKEEACGEWSPENVRICAARQDEILDAAAVMLRPGGRMVYSTCTFAPLENEGSVSRFVKRHPNFVIVEARKWAGMEGGRACWIEEPVEGLDKTVRLWPHKIRGEGHYAAVLQKLEAGYTEDRFIENGCGEKVIAGMGYIGKGYIRKEHMENGLGEKDYGEYIAFREQFLKPVWQGVYLRFGEQLYLAPENTPSLRGLKVLRPGLHLGTLKTKRFEPSHALALSLRPEDVALHYDLHPEGKEISAYLNGQAFQAEGEKGWYLITVGGYSIGWGKLAGGMMKNHYPKGLRVKEEVRCRKERI